MKLESVGLAERQKRQCENDQTPLRNRGNRADASWCKDAVIHAGTHITTIVHAITVSIAKTKSSRTATGAAL